MAALGSVPWVGGLFSGWAALRSDSAEAERNELYKSWLDEHAERFVQLGATLGEILDRLNQFGNEIQDRIESPEYLALVRKAFRAWDRADTQEKRDLVRKLLANAGASTLVPDDLIRLFIEWLDQYHETHFHVIRVIHQYPGSSRADIWDHMHGEEVREDSAEADLFKRLIRDLSIGGVVRQIRAKDSAGRFLKKPPSKRKQPRNPYAKSAFDDKEPYELTELGRQFVHYTMEEVVSRLEGG